MDNPEVHSWDVLTDDPNITVRVESNRCYLTEGHLAFESNGVITRAFAPGYWRWVRLLSPEFLRNEKTWMEQMAKIRELAPEVVKRNRGDG